MNVDIIDVTSEVPRHNSSVVCHAKQMELSRRARMKLVKDGIVQALSCEEIPKWQYLFSVQGVGSCSLGRQSSRQASKQNNTKYAVCPILSMMYLKHAKSIHNDIRGNPKHEF